LIKKVSEKSSVEKLIRKAMSNCRYPEYMGLFDQGFGFDFLSAQDIGSDKRDFIYLALV